MTDIEGQEKRCDKVSAFCLQIENLECFDDVTGYTVEVLVRENKKVEVMESKDR